MLVEGTGSGDDTYCMIEFVVWFVLKDVMEDDVTLALIEKESLLPCCFCCDKPFQEKELVNRVVVVVVVGAVLILAGRAVEESKEDIFVS